jgi:hypothetical protein
VPDSLPLDEDQMAFAGRMIHQQQVLIEIVVSKYTLRYTMKMPLPPAFSTGQCEVQSRKR